MSTLTLFLAAMLVIYFVVMEKKSNQLAKKRHERKVRKKDETQPQVAGLPPPSKTEIYWQRAGKGTQAFRRWVIIRWKEHDIFQSILAFLAIWILICLLLPAWWWQRWSENALYFLIASVAVILAALVGKKPEVKLSWRLSKIATILGFLVFANFIILKNDYSRKAWEDGRQGVKNWWYGGKHVSIPIPNLTLGGTGIGAARLNNPNVVLPENSQGKQVVEQFWNREKPDQAKVMIEHARRESNWNQFRPDGTPYRVVPKDLQDDRTAVGVMQIKESVWGSEAKRQHLNLYTWDGNLRFALWLCNMREAQGKRCDVDWDATSPQDRILVEAPWSDTSEWVKWGPGSIANPQGPVIIFDDKGIAYFDTNDGVVRPQIVSSKVRFQSKKEGETVIVIVTQ